MENKSKILIIEDWESDYLSMKKIIEKEIKSEVFNVSCKEEALNTLKKEKFDCIILDYMLPDCNGLHLLDEIKQKFDIPVLFVTGFGEEIIATKAIDLGATNYFSKDNITNSSDSTLFIECLKKIIEMKNFSESISEIKAKSKALNQKLNLQKEAVLETSLKPLVYQP